MHKTNLPGQLTELPITILPPTTHLVTLLPTIPKPTSASINLYLQFRDTKMQGWHSKLYNIHFEKKSGIQTHEQQVKLTMINVLPPHTNLSFFCNHYFLAQAKWEIIFCGALIDVI